MASTRRSIHRKPFLALVPMALLLLTTLLAGCGLGISADEVYATGPIEYAKEPVDVYDYLSCDVEGADIEVGDDVNARTVGVMALPITVSKGLGRDTGTVELVVQDTRAPEVTFAAPTVSVELGDSYDPYDNLAQATDPVDGALALVEHEPASHGTEVGLEDFYDEGWYRLEEAPTTDVAGTHEVVFEAVDRHGNQTTASYTLEVIDPLDGVELTQLRRKIQYAKATCDPLTLVSCDDEEVSITCDDTIDRSVVGRREVTYTLAKHHSTREVPFSFLVRDNKPPKIVLKRTKLKKYLHASFDPASNVKAVSDVVDGALKARTKPYKTRSEKPRSTQVYKAGFYLIDGTVDTEKPGTYDVKVSAFDQHGNEATETFVVEVVDPLEGVSLKKRTTNVEYSSKAVDPVSLVSCSSGDVHISATKLDLGKAGTQKVTYTLESHGVTKTLTKTFRVRDTKSPAISLVSSSVSIDEGTSFDARSNIASVTDPVDGDLPYVASEPSSAGDGWYTIEGTGDADLPGRHQIRVIACDRNGNRTTKTFDLDVAEKVVQPQSSYIINTNTGKFHHTWCSDVKRMAEHNKWYYTGTRDEVVNMGYVPCMHCNP